MTLHNPVKERLSKGLPTVGQWVSLPVPAIVELLAAYQMDWLTLDTEHLLHGVDQGVAPAAIVMCRRMATHGLDCIGGRNRRSFSHGGNETRRNGGDGHGSGSPDRWPPVRPAFDPLSRFFGLAGSDLRLRL